MIVNYEYKCHDCGTNCNVFGCLIGDQIYDLCGECIDEIEAENDEEE